MAKTILSLTGDEKKLSELSASIRLVSDSGPTMPELARKLNACFDQPTSVKRKSSE